MKREKIPASNEHFVLQEYKWLDFNSDAIVFPDNARASLVINELHDPEELSKRVRIPKSFGMKFRPAAAPLFPVDLSEDYRKFVAETAQRRKRRNFDDDDDAAEIDFSEISTPPDLEDRLTRWKTRKGEDENQAGTAGEAGSAAGSQGGSAQLDSGSGASSAKNNFVPDGFAADHAGGREVGAGGKPAASEARKGMRPAPDISQEARDRILAKLNASTGIGASGLPSSVGDLETDEELMGADSEATAESANAVDEQGPLGDESIAAATARDGVDAHFSAARSEVHAPEQNFGDHSDDPEKSSAAAYQSGYDSAIEKFRDLFAALESTSHEIQALRSKVLTEGRDIFLEMIKLTAEGVLRSQLAFSDDALGDLFRSALENVHQARRITVQANSETLTRLKSQFAEAKLEFEAIDWVASDKIPRGDFRVISKDEVIKVDLENLVSKKVTALAKDIFSSARVETDLASPAQEKSEPDSSSGDGSDDKEAS